MDGGAVATMLVGDEPGIVAILAVDHTGGTVNGIVRGDGQRSRLR